MKPRQIPGLTPDPKAPTYFYILNNDSGYNNMRSITFVHEIHKEFTEDIISNQGLNTVNFPEREGKGSREKKEHEQSQRACDVCTGNMV